MSNQLLKQGITFIRSCQILARRYRPIVRSKKITCLVFRKTQPVSNFSYYNSFKQFSTVANPALASTKTKEQSIYESLKFDCFSKKRVPKAGVLEFLRLTENLAEYTENQVTDLITCVSTCLPNVPAAKRQHLMEKIWSKRPTDLSEALLVAYLRASRFNKKNINVKEFLNQNQSPQVLQALLEVVCEMGDIAQTNEIVSKIKEKELPMNEAIMSTLIRGYGIAGNLDGVKSTLETIEIAKLSLTNTTYSEIIQTYLRLGMENESKQILKERLSMLKEVDLAQILLVALQTNASNDLIRTLVNHFSKDVLDDHEISYIFQNIFSELLVDNKFNAAFLLLDCLPTPQYGISEDLDKYGEFLLKELLKVNCPLNICLKFVDSLIESGKNERAMHVITGFALEAGSDAAESLLVELNKTESLRAHYFWPLFIQNFLLNGEAGILNVLKLMKKLNVEVDTETLSIHVIPKLGITLKNAEKGVKLLEAGGVKTSNMLTPLTVQLLFQQRLNEVLLINNLYQSKLDTEGLVHPLVTNFSLAKSGRNTISTIAKLIKLFKDKSQNLKYDFAGHFLVEVISNQKTKNEHQLIIDLLGELQTLEVKISKLAGEMLIQHLSGQLNDEQRQQYFKDFIDKRVSLPANELIENHIKHPRDMSLEELQCHVAELESKGLNVRGCLRRLLQLSVREEKLDLAIDVKQKCDKLKVDVSPGMLASIFDLFTKTGNIQEASKALKTLNYKFPGFLVDEHKIIDFAALVVQKGTISEAQKVIQLRASTSTVKGGEHLSKNIWNLLNNIATRAPTLDDANEKNHTRDFFLLLNKYNFCGYQNSILGPIIKEFLNKNDLKSAVTEYKSYCQYYRATPLQRQLMTVLVDASNRKELQKQYNVSEEEARQLLQEVIKATTTIHGAANTNIAFIVALAEAGTEKQLRKMLINPSARISPDILRKQCEFLNSIGKLDALIKLAKCSRGLGHIHEQEIYNMILDTLIKENNCKAAVVLFDQLIADDEFKINNEFSRNLVDLLKRNNLELPNNVALYAK